MKFFKKKKKKVVKQIPKKQLSTRNAPVKRIPSQQVRPNISLEDSIRQIKQEVKEAAENVQNGIERFVTEKPRPKDQQPKQTPIKNKPIEKSIPKNDPGKDFLKTFKQLTYSHRAWDVWRDFVTMLACSISNSVDKSHYDKREKLYLDTIKRYRKPEQQLFPELAAQLVLEMEKNPEQDFLGETFMILDLQNQRSGQFFTPYHICEFMDNVVQQVEKDGYITIHDSCCGAGATLIAGVHEAKRQLEEANMNFQNHVLVVGQDIDEAVALMCYIQISLLGVAGYVKVGNTFTDPIAPGDSLENYWFTPMYFSKVWSTRRLYHKSDTENQMYSDMANLKNSIEDYFDDLGDENGCEII